MLFCSVLFCSVQDRIQFSFSLVIFVLLHSTAGKPPSVSPGLIFVRKHSLTGLYTEGLVCNPNGRKKQELTIETAETVDFKTNEMSFKLRCADKRTR